MRCCGQKRLVEAASALHSFMPTHPILWAGIFYSYRLTSSPIADRYQRWYTLGRFLVNCLIPLPPCRMWPLLGPLLCGVTGYGYEAFYEVCRGP